MRKQAPRGRPADSPPLNLPPPAGGWSKHPPLPGPTYLQSAVTGRLTGAQITLVAAALLAPAARARAARRRHPRLNGTQPASPDATATTPRILPAVHQRRPRTADPALLPERRPQR